MKEKNDNNSRSLKWEQNGELAQKDLSELIERLKNVESKNISYLKSHGFKKVALVSELMNSDDPKEDAIMILKELFHVD